MTAIAGALQKAPSNSATYDKIAVSGSLTEPQPMTEFDLKKTKKKTKAALPNADEKAQ